MAVMQRELQYLPAVRRRQGRRWDRTGAIATFTVLGLILWIAYVLCSAAVSWAQVKLDDIRYGYPRTFQTDGYIGYREQSGLPTHFTVINAHRQVLIMIIPGGEPGRVSVIKGPYLFGPGQEFSPATLELIDANHDGYPDLRLHVAGQTLVYLNDPRHHSFIVSRSQEGTAR
jgi:hypothetical protein